MVNPNKKLKRADGLGKVFDYKIDKENNIYPVPIESLIKENYGYIYRAINIENFFIADNDTCHYFKEVVYDNEVVGFATYKNTNIVEQAIILQYFYVLPEYKDSDILIEELDDSSVLFSSNILIEYPTRDMVDLLIKHKFARVLDDRYVISKIPFIVPMFPLDDVHKEITREEFDTTDYTCYNKFSIIYDLDLCAIVGLAKDNIENIFTAEDIDEEKINDYNVISLALRDDNNKYDCINKRLNDKALGDATYFKNIKQILDDNDEMIQNWISIF